MIVLLHVTIAILSVIYSSLLLVAPKRSGFGFAYGLVVATLASGTYLVVSLRSQILQACVSGLAYLAIVASLLALARYRLAKQSS